MTFKKYLCHTITILVIATWLFAMVTGVRYTTSKIWGALPWVIEYDPASSIERQQPK